jgi:hypothetical protein
LQETIMSNGPIRRSQMISPFGVGSTVVLPDGTSVIACGLDNWFEREDKDFNAERVEIDDFTLREWRLERLLGVSHFRLPPDYRRSQIGRTVPNTHLTVPFLRFPRWHQCPRCARIEESSLFRRQALLCEKCREKGIKSSLSQVRFVAICDKGHLQDFPWLEWVHRTHNPRCRGPLRLLSSGSISIAGHTVRCDGCDVPDRSMSGSVYADPEKDSTHLTDRLSQEGRFTCPGRSPWLGDEDGTGCHRPLRVALRAASNVYYAQISSAIYLPRDEVPGDLLDILSSVTISTYLEVMQDLGEKVTADGLSKKFPERLSIFSPRHIEIALGQVSQDSIEETAEVVVNGVEESDDAFRREELVELLRDRSDSELVISSEPRDDYGASLPAAIIEVKLVRRLRETRAFTGFTRVFPEADTTPSERRRQLWRDYPHYRSRWLPACVVFGEGILLRFDQGLLERWEGRPEVNDRIQRLRHRFEDLGQERRLVRRAITPRLVLLHTFAHVVMNRLTFECGYSSAALRERLYVSPDPERPMASVLIYTAAGDSEGTLGGLVRMGRPGRLEPVVFSAIENARWCSADPVCLEVGRTGGQGPDSCNLSACHNCALVPETGLRAVQPFPRPRTLDRRSQYPPPGVLSLNMDAGFEPTDSPGSGAQVEAMVLCGPAPIWWAAASPFPEYLLQGVKDPLEIAFNLVFPEAEHRPALGE